MRHSMSMFRNKPIYTPDGPNNTYKNPLVYYDTPDPDVIAANGSFYMVTSSFNFTPGLPVYKSADLVHWKLVNHALIRFPGTFYDTPQHAGGAWAPSIRFYKGLYYVYFGMPDDGIFCVTAKDPEGEWSEPHLVKEGKGLIDPCPFFTPEGNYIVHAFAKSRAGFNSVLNVFGLSDDGLYSTTETKTIFKDPLNEPTIEGPKVYTRNGYIYIWAPAGKVTVGWQTVLRGKSIYGPFEKRRVLQQGSTSVNGPHQGALVTANGSDWFLHFQQTFANGRVLHMQPVKWEDDWPVVGCNGEPVSSWQKPFPDSPGSHFYEDGSDDFSGDLNPFWQVSANLNKKFFETENGRLKIFSNYYASDFFSCPCLITQPVFAPDYKVSVVVHWEHLLPSESAGVLFLGTDYHGLGVTMSLKGKPYISEFYDSTYVSVVPLEERSMRIVLHGDIKGNYNMYAVSEKKGTLLYSSSKDINELPLHLAGHNWVGARVCLFSDSKVKKGPFGYAEFSDFRQGART